MAIKLFKIETPEQLRELHAIRPDMNQYMENLARVWRALRTFASVNNCDPLSSPVAEVMFDGKARSAVVYKIIGHVEIIGRLPYNQALSYCRANLKLEG